MSIAIAKNHMAEMNMLGMLAVLDKTLTEATRDKIRYVPKQVFLRPQS